MKKKILIAVWCVILCVLIALAYNYIRTGKASTAFFQDRLRMSDLSELGFINPYKDHYNKGAAHYSEGDYEAAEAEFREALSKKHTDKDDTDCKIRINLALSMVKPLTRESINADNVDLAIEILKEARDILCEQGCADMENEEWHNDDAQTLKEEIDEYIKELEDMKNQQQQQQQDPNSGNGGGQGGGQDNNNGQGNNDGQGGDNGDNGEGGGNGDQDNDGQGDNGENGGGGNPDDDLLDQLDEIQQDGLNERGGTDDETYQYYDGKSW